MATGTQKSLSLDDDSVRFFRLFAILVDVGTNVLRNILHKEHPETTFSQVLQKHQVLWTDLHSKKVLTPLQKEKLFPATGAADSSTFDITLFCILLRNICPNTVKGPQNGWYRQPANADLSVGADIMRLKEIRNVVVSHTPKAKLTLKVYNTTEGKLKCVLDRLAKIVSPEFAKQIDANIQNIKSNPLDCHSYSKWTFDLLGWCLEEIEHGNIIIKDSFEGILVLLNDVLKAVNTPSYFPVLLKAWKDAEKAQLDTGKKVDQLMKLAYSNRDHASHLKLGLTKWMKELKKDVTVDILLPRLLEAEVFNREESKQVETEDGQEKQVDRMLFIVNSKDNECVLKFCKYLREFYPKLANLVENEADDGYMTEELLQSIEEDRIKKILVSDFEKGDGSSISAEDLHAIVARKLGGCPIKFECLQCIVAEVFIGSRYEEKDAKFIFTGIKRKTDKDGDANQMLETNLRQETPLQDISVEMFHDILADKFKKAGIDPGKVLEVFSKEDINVTTFLKMTEKEMEKVFGSHLKLTFGIRKTLSETQKVLSENIKFDSGDQKAMKCQETFRTFAHPTSAVDVYKRGGVLTSSVSGFYNLIDPVHRFMVPPKYLEDQNQWLSKQTVRFAAACLNSRINGTIHFGVEASDDGDECKGEIKGMRVTNRDDVRKEISAALKKCFSEKQVGIVRKCILDVQFVPVSDKEKKSTLYVIEIDVEPSSVHTGTELFAIMFPPYGPSKRSVFAYASSLILLDSTLENQFQDELKSLAETRKQKEDRALQNNREFDLGVHLHNLVTKGNKYITDELYPILFVGPLASHMDRRFLEENLDFVVHMLGSLNAVFQFDSGDQLLKFVESNDENPCFVLLPDHFNKRDIDSVKENLASGNKTPWIFCNGNEQNPVMEIVDWNQERREGVQEAIRFLSHEYIPDERAVVIFLLFEKIDDTENGNPMLEAADEVFLKFKNQWILLAENPGVAENWMTALCMRKKVQKREIAERFIVGLQWYKVNEIMKSVIKNSKMETCYLPVSYGKECTVTAKENIEKVLDDLEILSSRQFQEERSRMSANDLKTKKEDFEEEFYRGALVSWWNFLFEDQVVERQIFPKLLGNIKNKLMKKDFDEDQLVLTETLRHHAGAGGSTLGRHCLWHLSQSQSDPAKLIYRCCVIKKITTETASQIEKFRKFKDDGANRPVIALLDNESDEKVSHLLQHLHCLANKSENAGGLFCLLFIVKRTSILGQKEVPSDIVLTHQLSPEEIAWFHKKTEHLENYARNHDSRKMKLENLIAFNLMKQEFNKSYIKDVAKRFYEDINNYSEKRFLKCLAFINSYDMLFQPIPSSVFDQMMSPMPIPKGHVHLEPLIGSPPMGLTVPLRRRFVPCKEEYTWNAKMSKALQTLLIKKSPDGQGYTTGGLSIISQDLANELLQQIMTGSGQSVYDVALEVLEVVKQHVPEKNLCSKNFVEIVNSLFKNRWFSEEGHKRDFSELVLALNDLEDDGDRKVIELMEKCFQLTENPMVAQQLARFLYIKCKNWTKAVAVIKQAIEKKESSYLLDTYGHILKNKMEQVWEVEELINLAFDAMDKFRKGQKVCKNSEEEQNNSVFHGEINTGLDLVDKFQKLNCYPGEKEFHRFLVDPNFIPQKFQSIYNTNLYRLKKRELYKNLNNALRVLEEKVYQVKGKRYTSTPIKESEDNLESLRERLEVYYSTEKSHTWSRYVHGYGLDRIMKLRETNSEVLDDRYHKAISALSSSVKDTESEYQDLLIALGTTLASLSYNSTYSEELVDYHKLLKWSEKLYNLSSSVSQPYMEAYLYLVIFHWPTAARKDLPRCQLDKLKSALEDTKIMYDKKHNVQSQKEKKENFQRLVPPKTFFFLGKGTPGHDIVHYKQIYGRTQLKGNDLWHTPEAVERLQRLDGFLCFGGKAIDYVFSHHGVKHKINIQTSLPVSRYLGMKSVSFLLGFSWSGPIAYDVLKKEQDSEENQSVQNSGSREADVETANQQTPTMNQSSTAVEKEIMESRGAIGGNAADEYEKNNGGGKTPEPAQTKNEDQSKANGRKKKKKKKKGRHKNGQE